MLKIGQRWRKRESLNYIIEIISIIDQSRAKVKYLQDNVCPQLIGWIVIPLYSDKNDYWELLEGQENCI